MDFDFDYVTYDYLIDELKDIINEDSYNILETRGGHHVLVEMIKIEGEFRKNWYNNITKIKGCDISGDNLIPVVGCTQGNFVPHFV
jgi:hypothetical protein